MYQTSYDAEEAVNIGWVPCTPSERKPHDRTWTETRDATPLPSIEGPKEESSYIAPYDENLEWMMRSM